MADSYSCNINIDPDSVGNMYYRGVWQFCPEYKTGDVVKHNDVLYLCVKPNAGKDPIEKGNYEYWHGLASVSSEDSDTTVTRKTLDGGYATTSGTDSYAQTTMISANDGGSASGQVSMPLI